MAVNTTLSGLSQTAASNGPDGASDPPSSFDDAVKYALSFIATLRDGKGFAAEVDVASAATTDIGGANSFFVRVTGTTTITSLGTSYNGPRFIRFAGALTLTHNASSLVLPGWANITTAAGDTCVATPISGGWVVSQYTRASGGLVSQTGTAPTYGARAWVNFNGITGAIRSSGNVSAVTRNAAGDYTITFSTDMPDANYCITGTASRTGTSGSAGVGYTLTANDNVAARTASACRVAVLGNAGDGAYDQMLDSPQVNVVFFR